jgi:hypothetical protein
MKSLSRLLSILLYCGLLAGCSTLNKRIDPSLSLEDCSYEERKTHYHQVLDELGPPTRLTALPNGFAFIYESLRIREWQMGIGGQTGWLQLLKLAFADTKLFRHSLLLHFDSDGVLISYGLLDSKESLGKAGALQPILSLEQIVDTSSYEDDAIDAANWGANLLRPLPVAINTEQNLNTGASGLEQSGTTTQVGQQTLEMR